MTTIVTEPDTAETVPGTDVEVLDTVRRVPVVATPTVAELEAIEFMCTRYAESDIVPKDFRGKADNVFAVAVAGRTHGWDVFASMQNFYVVEGTASMRPRAVVSVIRKAGHRLSFDESHQRVAVTGTRYDTGETHTVEWTLADADRADLRRVWSSKQRKEIDAPGWKRYPRAMLRWRAVAELGRLLFSDVVDGIAYVPEELLDGALEVGADGMPDLTPGVSSSAPTEPWEPPTPEMEHAAKLRGEAKDKVMAAARGDRFVAKASWDRIVGLAEPDHPLYDQLVAAACADAALDAAAEKVDDTDPVDDAELVDPQPAATILDNGGPEALEQTCLDPERPFE